jgi:1,4-dihydroxy-2-naphthoyl-CoA hydrolase
MDLLSRLKDNPLPFATLLGIELVSAAPDRIVAEMTVREDLCTCPAVLHGGAIMAFADTLGALGTIANLLQTASSPPASAGQTASSITPTATVTIESKTNFLGPAPLGARLTGETTAIHVGRRTMVWQTRITTETGKLVSHTTQTQLVV